MTALPDPTAGSPVGGATQTSGAATDVAAEAAEVLKPGPQVQGSAVSSGQQIDDRLSHSMQGARQNKLSWLRAAVLGANDGIVSVAGLLLGVAATTAERGPLFTAGLAGLSAGAVSMALGEYVSVSSQRDSEHALLRHQRRELAEMPDEELHELAALYEAKGVTPETALKVAQELTAHDALAAHLDVELKLDPEDIVSPWHAAYASALSFLMGGLLPILAMLVPPPGWRVAVTFVGVLVALAVTGAVSSRIGGGNVRRAVLRVVVGGALGLAVTFGIGLLFGAAVG